jgi:two-component system chemotaxis response regulator CheB
MASPLNATHPRRFLHAPEPAFDLVVLAASAGGVTALSTLVAELPGEFPVPIVIAQHLPRTGSSILVDILRRRTRLAVASAANGRKLRPRTIYVAPPGHLLRVARRRTLVVSHEPRPGARPDADLLLETAAAHMRCVLAVVLSGSGHDGAEGARAVRGAGGVVIVQDPATCEFRPMPEASISAGAASFVLPLATIAPALVSLVMVPGAPGIFGVPGHAA